MWWFLLFSYQVITAKAVNIIDEPSSIINGDLVSIEDYPFYVYLSYGESRYLKCGATLIQPNILLTAAHCVSPSSKVSVRTGITSTADLNEAKLYQVEDVYIHPEYKLNNTFHETVHDIALIKLTEDVVFGDKVKLIALGEDEPPVGEQVTVIGFGIDICDKFHESLSKICLNPTSKVLRQAILNVTAFDDTVIDSVGSGSQTVCYGDSGGPMTYNNKLIGVASEVEFADCTGGSTYTRVDNHLDWIQEYIQISNMNKNYSSSEISWW